MNLIHIFHNGLYLDFTITPEHQLKFLHFSCVPLEVEQLKLGHRSAAAACWESDHLKQGWQIAQVQVPGYDRPYERPGDKHLCCAPACYMKYLSHSDEENVIGRLLTFHQKDALSGLHLTTYFQFYGTLPVVRCWSTVTNEGESAQTLTHLSSFFYQGVEKEGDGFADEKLSLSIPHNSWMKELNWKRYTLADVGLQNTQPRYETPRTSKAFRISNTGNWSTKEYLPMGCIDNHAAGTTLFWQIEHNGSWLAELSDYNGHYCLNLGGPTENQSHWWKVLQPGDSFTCVPVAVGSTKEGFDGAMGALTRYRRLIRRPNADNETLPIIFNDYMNCLCGDPTPEKELPLIDAAAQLGCEYYVIDAGWYSDGFWWDTVGEWKASKGRFPGGLRSLMDYIRSKGMIPGLWLELEVMGIHSPLFKALPKECFFQRHGQLIYDRSRVQLDFRHPKVIDHANEVVRRLVEDYGAGYIKMDYNIEPGIGTDWNADSPGDGLLEHEQAYLRWLEEQFRCYPELVIENCSSGGLRMDYAMLSRYSLQSTSDQEDYRMYATVSANAPSAVTPEQAAVWSYPLRDGDREETIFNMVNALMLRIHQSGQMDKLSPERFALVREGLDWYRSVRHHWKNAVPHFPLGWSDYRDNWSALMLEDGGFCALALWRRGGEAEKTIPLPYLAGRNLKIKCAYPDNRCDFHWDEENGLLTVHFPEKNMARIFVMEE